MKHSLEIKEDQCIDNTVLVYKGRGWDQKHPHIIAKPMFRCRPRLESHSLASRLKSRLLVNLFTLAASSVLKRGTSNCPSAMHDSQTDC